MARQWITVREAEVWTGISLSTIRSEIRKSNLHTHRREGITMIATAELARWYRIRIPISARPGNSDTADEADRTIPVDRPESPQPFSVKEWLNETG
jgi:hypothetical protein